MTETVPDNSVEVYSGDMGKIDIVNSALAHDKDAFMQAFNSAIAQKVSDALEVKKVEVASSLLNYDNMDQEVEQELETTEVTTETETEET